ncbi:MAG TPA: HypC/HybG/HupF family hydrogenase formation chaperone [Oculatellaceae cyanobacterium]
MCLAIPGKIESFVDVERHFARADIGGVKRQINVDLLREDGIEIGDWVLIHVGFAMSKISEEQAKEQFEILMTLGESMQSNEEARGYSFDFSNSEAER